MTTNARDTAENLSQIYSRSKDWFQDFAQRTKNMYGETFDWLGQNSGRAIGLGSALTAAAFIGYFIGKSGASKKQFQQAIPEASNSANLLSHGFKFLKLWMLYRAAV